MKRNPRTHTPGDHRPTKKPQNVENVLGSGAVVARKEDALRWSNLAPPSRKTSVFRRRDADKRQSVGAGRRWVVEENRNSRTRWAGGCTNAPGRFEEDWLDTSGCNSEKHCRRRDGGDKRIREQLIRWKKLVLAKLVGNWKLKKVDVCRCLE